MNEPTATEISQAAAREELAIKSYMHDMPKIIKQLDFAYDEQGLEHAGPIRNNVAFIALKRMVEEDQITFESYQKYVKDGVLPTARTREGNERLNHMGLGLCGEAGELANLIKKINMGKPVTTEMLADELCDVFWYAVAIACELGYSVRDIIAMNIEKLNGRYGTNAAKEEYLNR